MRIFIPAWASFSGKASIQDITNPLAPVAVDGNATVKVDMMDRTDAGTGDAIAITIWNKTGAVLFASNWNGIFSEQQVLAGGNININNGASLLETIISAITDASDDHGQGSLLSVAMAPNPAIAYTNLTINADVAKGNVRIKVTDLFGKVIETKEIAAGRNIIQLGNSYRPGIYVIEVTQGQDRKTVQLIKLTQ